MLKCIYLLILLLSVNIVNAQSPFKGFEHLFTQPKGYVVAHTNIAPTIDGDINDKVWESAKWTDYFVDIEGDLKPKPYYNTRVKMLWDDKYLYIAADLSDKHVWAYLTKHDQVVFYDNDFEVFINPSNSTHQYFEYEINAQNTIFDLFLPKTYRAGTGALISWDSKTLKSAVKVKGTLNNPSDEDEGWTVEMAIPFSDISVGNNANIPKNNAIWRLNFSRVQWETEIIDGKYVKKTDANNKQLPENNWVWSPQGIINMHAPERWGYIQFSTNEAGSELPEFKMPYSELQQQYLWLIYYKQQEYRSKNGKYANSPSDLGINSTIQINGINNQLSIEATTYQYTAIITDSKSRPVKINDEGLIR